jgi:hypothetical protein
VRQQAALANPRSLATVTKSCYLALVEGFRFYLDPFLYACGWASPIVPESPSRRMLAPAMAMATMDKLNA